MSEAASLENFSEGDRELASLAKTLANDPSTRKDFLRLVKKQSPKTPIPEIDIEESLSQFAKPHLDKLAQMEKAALERDVKDKIESRRRGLKDSKGYSDDDITAIEKMMVEKGIASHETAAQFYDMEKKLAQPSPSSLARMTTSLPVDKKSIKEAGGVKKWALTEAFKAAEEIKAGRVKFA